MFFSVSTFSYKVGKTEKNYFSRPKFSIIKIFIEGVLYVKL